LNKKKIEESNKAREERKISKHVAAKLKGNAKTRVIDQNLADLFNSGYILACISSRPGQTGRCTGYILEGKELEFYQKQLAKKKGKKQ